MALFNISSKVLVRCISRSHRLKIDFQNETFKNLLSKTTRPRALIFGMFHNLVDPHSLFKLCPCAPKWAGPRGHMFYIVLLSDFINLTQVHNFTVSAQDSFTFRRLSVFTVSFTRILQVLIQIMKRFALYY